jgi:hypothetical protein
LFICIGKPKRHRDGKLLYNATNALKKGKNVLDGTFYYLLHNSCSKYAMDDKESRHDRISRAIQRSFSVDCC